MIFSKSITFDGEELSKADVSSGALSTLPAEGPLFIEKLKAGDSMAFDTLIDRYSGDIYALLFRITGDSEEARDLTQDTFIRVLRSIVGFRGDSELKTWLYRVAINESRNRFRWWKRRRRNVTISLDTPIGDTDIAIGDTVLDRSASPEDTALLRERTYAVKAALMEIPEAYRVAVVLCDIEGLSYEETAAALGVGIGTVKSRIARGREQLRRKLADY